MNIQNKTFIVTGGASGLGLATAKMVIDNGGNAVLLDINAKAGEEAENTLGKNARFVQADVADEASVQNVIDTAISTFGALHGAISCAGIGPGERVIGKNGPHSLANFTRTITINLIGTFNVIRLASAVLQNNPTEESGERGIIISTASVAAFDGQIGQAGYSASKGGIVAMTLPIARELARFGIRVMTIAPGTFETPLLAGLPEDIRTSLGQQVPFPSRLGRPEEFASLAKHIIENQMLNGEVIRLDGAIRMAAK
ncbi:3-hydroxyacyl-CoA dehydrogenase [Arcicella lustrica]|uniref:3-hydroxyacyl-CoA dehydrogenase n=1 Tax=Arcicella lustrica TaxID=2984196 RepID=A0ABU5SDE8_9BACT|nr:3-hydroxyacyl-CoA dehydrogenase [Arcicella sp. DC25W]MEA5425320.1 3-hydroxyacyl-CoA dehydrogenase [Arcicella sp. DC25W]